MVNETQIAIAVSSCLLGHNVRYDGTNKYNDLMCSDICKQFHCVAVCPEYAVGLGVPRSPLKLVIENRQMRMLAVDAEHTDISDRVIKYADFFLEAYPKICGYIFKSKSPSCGLRNIPIFNGTGDVARKGQGVFSQRVTVLRPSLPVIDELGIQDKLLRTTFIRQIKEFAQQLN
ncbi:DUF523 domain-containing protein [Kaarinaea lacus]